MCVTNKFVLLYERARKCGSSFLIFLGGAEEDMDMGLSLW